MATSIQLSDPVIGKRFRNTSSMIAKTRQHFDVAHERGLMAVHGISGEGRKVRISSPNFDDASVVDFVRCSYLGLDNHPSVVAGAVAAINRYGSLHWSCARTRLNFVGIRDLEGELSRLFDVRAITYSSVMVANMGALPLLASGTLTQGRKPTMIFDQNAHISLSFHKPVVAEETRVGTIAHNDLDALEQICRSQADVAYICDGVYSMGGHAQIGDLLWLQQKYGLFLYIDDAHGISLFGAHGEGFARSQMHGELGDRTIIAASLGKGFGASGGMLMLGTEEQENLFRRYAVAHAFSASPNLAAVGAAMASAALHETEELGELQQKLAARISQFDKRIITVQRGDRLPIRTLIVGDEFKAMEMCATLLDRGFYTSVIFFPTVARGQAGLRICPTATHTIGEIEALCEAIEDLGVPLNTVADFGR
jgi:8-amino-7-oxononanoate synthase